MPKIKDIDIYELEEEQDILMPDPEESDAWRHEFDGTFIGTKKRKGQVYAQVQDMDDDVFDIEIERIIDQGRLSLEKIAKLPHDTLAKAKERAQLILEYENQYCDSDECDDPVYFEGLRDGYSRALNDLFGTGNPK